MRSETFSPKLNNLSGFRVFFFHLAASRVESFGGTEICLRISPFTIRSFEQLTKNGRKESIGRERPPIVKPHAYLFSS